MTIDVLNALPLIGEPERTKLHIAVILAIIFVRRERCDCDLKKTTIKMRDGDGDQKDL